MDAKLQTLAEPIVDKLVPMGPAAALQEKLTYINFFTPWHVSKAFDLARRSHQVDAKTMMHRIHESWMALGEHERRATRARWAKVRAIMKAAEKDEAAPVFLQFKRLGVHTPVPLHTQLLKEASIYECSLRCLVHLYSLHTQIQEVLGMYEDDFGRAVGEPQVPANPEDEESAAASSKSIADTDPYFRVVGEHDPIYLHLQSMPKGKKS